jgi:hypothetical protein
LFNRRHLLRGSALITAGALGSLGTKTLENLRRLPERDNPFPKRPPVVIAGDSRGFNHKDGSLWSVRGPMVWARYKLGHRFDIDHRWVTAIGGTQIAVDNEHGVSLLSQLPQAFSFNPGFVAAFSDVNDITNGRTGEQMVLDMTAVIDRIRQQGIGCILFTCIVPRFWNAKQRMHHDRYNNWLRSQATRDGVILIDAEQSVLDWSSNTSGSIGSGAAGFLYDTTHFGPMAAELIGDDIASALDPYLPSEVWGTQGSPTDFFDAQLNPQGNLLTGLSFSRGGGVLRDISDSPDTTVAGDCAHGCRLYRERENDINVLGSTGFGEVSFGFKKVRIPVQNIKVTGGSGGLQRAIFRLPDITVALQPGDDVEAQAFVNIKRSRGLYGAGIQLFDSSSKGEVLQTFGDMHSWNNKDVYSYLANRPRAGVQRSSLMKLSAASSKLQTHLVIEVDAAVADVEVEVGNFTVRKAS